MVVILYSVAGGALLQEQALEAAEHLQSGGPSAVTKGAPGDFLATFHFLEHSTY
jgi:hypothetical protein